MPKNTVKASLKFSASYRLVKSGNLPLASGCVADQKYLLTVQRHYSHLSWWPINRKVCTLEADAADSQQWGDSVVSPAGLELALSAVD
jgi:hypothetical protein